MTVLAIDLGGTHVRLALGDGVGDWQHTYTARRPPDMPPAAFIRLVGDVLASWRAEPILPDALGVSIAGLVDQAGTIRRAENLGWQNVELGPLLSGAFDRPATVETDVFCGAHFEARFGAARAAPCFLYVSIGTGIGHALIFDGTVWRGVGGAASAAGHLVLRPDGTACYCGNTGCLCTIASGLVQSAGNPPADGLEALAQAIGATATLVEPAFVVLAGGALKQPWFDLRTLEALLPRFSYPGITLPHLFTSAVPDPNLRGAALLARETK